MKRRTFLVSGMQFSTGLAFRKSRSGKILPILLSAGAENSLYELKKSFVSPPGTAKPLTIWHWMNGVISKEGITADLESFKAVGLAGVQLFFVGGSEALIDDPTHQIMGEKWKELLKFAINECTRLGLEFGTHNSPGWSSTGYKTVTPEQSMQKVIFSEIKVAGPQHFEKEVPQPLATLNYYSDIALYAVRDEQIIDLEKMIDLSLQFSGNLLQWQVPEGKWIIVRVGHTTTGKVNLTAPISGQGLEVDKLSPHSLDNFWKEFPDPIIDEAGKNAGNSFKRFEIDSYEQGPQDWTVNYKEEFIKRWGYDPIPWLLTLTGKIVNNKEQSSRFRYDMKETIQELFAENYFREMQKLVHQVPGMELIIEPYATGPDQPFESNNVAAYGDLLMCEFWQKPTQWGWDLVKPTVSGAHTWGKTLVAAEAFTGQPNSAWKVDPYALKSTGDRAFAGGVNKLFFHTSAHQPWMHVLPGMTMGQWGTHFGRTQTWWYYGAKEWISYLTRCQYLLQQGLSSCDICYLVYERVIPPVIEGYDCDTIGTDALLTRLTIKNKQLILPNGITYKVLVLPDNTKMRPEIIQKIRQLVNGGAVVIGPKPESSPSLQNFPLCDKTVQSIADEVWGINNFDDHAYGSGHVYQQPVAEAIKKIGLQPDLVFVTKSGIHPLLWIHRESPDGSQIYFLSNQEDTSVTAKISFRVKDMLPEFWHAETGKTEKVLFWKVAGERTEIDIELPASGSVFVIFVKSSDKANSILRLASDNNIQPAMTSLQEEEGKIYLYASGNGAYSIENSVGKIKNFFVKTVPPVIHIEEPWKVVFDEQANNQETIQLQKLISWTELKGDAQYFSGTATYTTTFDFPAHDLQKSRRQFLDLGAIKNTARIKLNGKIVKQLWAPPFQCEITDYLQRGKNMLEIDVTNLWANRMIGDEQYPDDLQWKGNALAILPAWVTNGQPRPDNKRKTFATYKFFGKNDPLLISGLLGPVKIYSVLKVFVYPY